MKRILSVLLCTVLAFASLVGCENQPNVEGIQISKPASKLTYDIGEELSLDGLIVQAKLSNSFFKELDSKDYIVESNFDNSKEGNYHVTVKYKGNESLTAAYDITVNHIDVQSLAIKTPAVKQIYEIGEKLDFSGIELQKTMLNGAVVKVSLSDCHIATDHAQSAGIYEVNFMLKEDTSKKVMYSVTVNEAKAEALILNTEEVKVAYNVGEEINYSGLSVNFKMSDGTIRELGKDEYEILTDFNSTLGGEYSVNVAVKNSEFSSSYTVEVCSVVSGLEIATPADKLVYKRNENISYKGLALNKVFNDGKKIALTSDDYTITTDYNKALGGEYTVSIVLKMDSSIGLQYKVTVEKTLSSVDVKTNPTKIKYQIGEELDLTGMVVQLKYNDYSTQIIEANKYTVDTSKFDKTKGGRYRITVSLNDDTAKTDYFSVDVIKNIVSYNVSQGSAPGKTVYEKGEDISIRDDIKGLDVKLSYNDGTTGSASLYAFKYETDHNKEIAGTYSVTLTFNLSTYPDYAPVQDFSYTYNITVREPVISGLAIVAYPEKMSYISGETPDYSGLKLSFVNSDGSKTEISDSSLYKIETDFVENTEGIYTVTITYLANERIIVKFSIAINQQSAKITFETNLKNNAQVLGSKYTFDFTAKDSSGDKLSEVNFSIDGNASIYINWDDSEKTSYTIILNNQYQNYKIVFTASDDYGNFALKEIKINHPPVNKGDRIGTVTFSVEAFTIGHGYLAEPAKIDIYEGENCVYTLARALRYNGYCFTYTGSLASGFYIQRVISGTEHNISNCACKELKDTVPIINPKHLLVAVNPPQIIIDQIGEIDAESYTQGSLGEFDFNFMSGWMYAVNGVLPNVGFADCFPMDGDVIRAQFSLAFGADIGGGWGGEYFESVSKDALTELLARVKAENAELRCAKEYNAALNAVKELGITQVKLDAAKLALETKLASA